ncbi:MAG: hypothetical protein OQK75_14125 [Gammaproteobacteria bacterium]|nr:hypothetical protein [Gammaproteobacteria bacterium]MCW8988796.1 hypothetical protein [Gammaproteobacteria bacterium]MCW9031758.1 hypothetical protein [Gammaproteobacteria bacterium]
MKSLLYDLRPMRIVLLLTVLISIIFKPAPGTELVYEGWEVFSTLLLPVFSPILLMLLWLDSLIAKLWSTQTEGKEQKRYIMILRINLILSFIFILVWYPYFQALTE